MISEFLDAIEQRIGAYLSGAFHWIVEPLYLLEWYVLLALLLGVCLLVGYFAPFKWVRAGLGVVLALGIAFVAGGTKMYRHMRSAERRSDDQP